MKDTEKLRQIMGVKLHKLRTDKKVSQEAIGIALGLSRCAVNNLENGRQGFTSEVVLKLSSILDCAILDLFPSKEEYTPEIKTASEAEESRINRKIQLLTARLEKLKSQS